MTAPGVQPLGIEQWGFKYFWLYGLIEPKTGESFFAELSHVDGICFQEYLKWFAEEYPEEFHIIENIGSETPPFYGGFTLPF